MNALAPAKSAGGGPRAGEGGVDVAIAQLAEWITGASQYRALRIAHCAVCQALGPSNAGPQEGSTRANTRENQRARQMGRCVRAIGLLPCRYCGDIAVIFPEPGKGARSDSGIAWPSGCSLSEAAPIAQMYPRFPDSGRQNSTVAFLAMPSFSAPPLVSEAPSAARARIRRWRFPRLGGFNGR